MKDPSGSRRIAGIFARHDVALELICGADFPGIVSSGASSGDRNRSYGSKSAASPRPADAKEHSRAEPRARLGGHAKPHSRSCERDWPGGPQGPPRSPGPRERKNKQPKPGLPGGRPDSQGPRKQQQHTAQTKITIGRGLPGAPKSTGTPRTQHHTTKDILGAHT